MLIGDIIFELIEWYLNMIKCYEVVLQVLIYDIWLLIAFERLCKSIIKLEDRYGKITNELIQFGDEIWYDQMLHIE